MPKKRARQQQAQMRDRRRSDRIAARREPRWAAVVFLAALTRFEKGVQTLRARLPRSSRSRGGSPFGGERARQRRIDHGALPAIAARSGSDAARRKRVAGEVIGQLGVRAHVVVRNEFGSGSLAGAGTRRAVVRRARGHRRIGSVPSLRAGVVACAVVPVVFVAFSVLAVFAVVPVVVVGIVIAPLACTPIVRSGKTEFGFYAVKHASLRFPSSRQLHSTTCFVSFGDCRRCVSVSFSRAPTLPFALCSQTSYRTPRARCALW